ncbi:YdbL family protein [Caulobacter sp. 17J80-11]|uniref:YdbL family protein n=1 Tax=Caulobacter sp. 17J80-11 TaxID=2763502 RepID=UPI0016536508|nr:YdbL family protein [Caulobacter sp. 17J80-11]MBC6982921.1 YdbL family protein [Caulobacter sp. 17J80-11]
MSMRTFFAGLSAALIGLFALAGAATAQVPNAKALVDAAKAQGVVGEQSDGYLGFVSDGGDPALKAAVAQINAGRGQVYRDAAAKTGVSAEAAGASSFAQRFPSMPAGQYYRAADGSWKQK